MEVSEQCNDSCLGDDYCVGNKMCCYDGCSYVCMDPVPSEPGTNSFFYFVSYLFAIPYNLVFVAKT